MTKKELRCIHRHTIETHPNCFRKGLIKREDWWHDKRIGYFDIEASNLDANWGFVLSWCIKYRDEDKIVSDIISQEEIYNMTFDKRVMKTLIEELENVDILVTYYGTGFDIPYIRTRALLWDYEFPEFGSIYHWDLYYKVRSKLKLSSNSLGSATKFFGIEGKTHLSPDWFMKAKYGHKKALKELLHHNEEDVLILQRLHDKLWKHSKWIRKSI
jgi:uncharacterized protein YprB with RNaseH-like and TPR domain